MNPEIPKNRIRWGIGFLFAIGASLVVAQETPLPSVADLRQRLNTVEQASDLTPSEKLKISNLYQLAIARIQAAERFDEETRSYTQALADLPHESARLRTEQQSYQPATIRDSLKTAPLDVIEQRVVEAEAQVTTLRTRLTQLRSTLQSERGIGLQQLIVQMRQGVENAATSAYPINTSEPAQVAASIALAAEQRVQQAQLAALEQRLTSRPARLVLMEAKADLLDKQLTGAEADQATLRSLLIQRRQDRTADLLSEVTAFAQSLASAPPALQTLADGNIQLAKTLTTLASRRQTTQQRLASLQHQITTLDDKFHALNRLLELGQFEASATFGAALRQEWDKASKAAAPAAIEAGLGQELTSSRVALFYLEEAPPLDTLPTESALQAATGIASPKWR